MSRFGAAVRGQGPTAASSRCAAMFGLYVISEDVGM
jgi:hypothetical protein